MNQNIFKAFLKQQGLPLRRFHESMFLTALRLLSVRIVWFASGGPGPAEPFFFRITGARMNGLTELLTVADICKKLGVSRAWVIEHSNGRRRPVLPSIKLGKVRRFAPTDLQGFIDDCRRIGQTRVRSASGRAQA